MKRIYTILMALLLGSSFSVMTTSCLGDNEEEVTKEDKVAEYTKNIVGLWLLEGKDTDGEAVCEYWLFNEKGTGTYAYGSNWDKVDDVTYEDVQAGYGNNFQWSIDANGLMVIYKVGESYNDPDPDAPFVIKSITDKAMTWVTSDGYTQTLLRKSLDELKKSAS